MIAQNRVHLERTHYNVYIVPLLDLSFIVWSTDGWLGHWNSSSSSSSSHPPVFHRIPRLLPFPTISNIPSTDRISFFFSFFFISFVFIPFPLCSLSQIRSFTIYRQTIAHYYYMYHRPIDKKHLYTRLNRQQQQQQQQQKSAIACSSFAARQKRRSCAIAHWALTRPVAQTPAIIITSLHRNVFNTPCAVLISSSYLTYFYYLFGFHSKLRLFFIFIFIFICFFVSRILGGCINIS